MISSTSLDLNGGWRLYDATGPNAPAWDEAHVVAQVPGEVHQQLMAAGRLPDPWVDQNYLEQIPLEANHWWLARRFARPAWADASCWLVFEGIDCRSEVWLNGRRLGAFDGMLGGPVFDVSVRLADENELLVHILPAETQPGVAQEFWRRGQLFEEDFAPLHRYLKPPALVGGNGFPPRVVTAGIWLPVRLERRASVDLADAWAQTCSVTADGEAAGLRLHFAACQEGEAEVRCRLIDPDEHEVVNIARTVTFRQGQASCDLTLDHPRLWWPNGHGEAALYRLEANLAGGATVTRQVGVRTVRWVQTPGTDKRLTLEVNGKRIYAGGASWSSGDRPMRFDPERYRWVLSLLRDAHMTYLRVWGGLPCEPRCFYELCDEFGLLITQDFPLTNYVNDPAVLRRIDPAIYELQVRHLVRGLRGHACIIGWVGGNELRSDEIAGGALSVLLDQAEHVVRELDPDTNRRWLRSSYALESGLTDEYDHFGRCQPECDVLAEMLDSEPRFAVEYFPASHHAMVVPDLRAAARFVPEALRLWPPPVWTHLRRINGCSWDQCFLTGTLPEEAHPLTAAPYRSWEELAYYTQANALTNIEAVLGNWRGRWPEHTGSNLWHAHDQQPMFSWGVVDYFGAPKGLYYGCKRGLAPVRAVMKYSRPHRDVRERLRGWVRVINLSDQPLRDHRVDVRVYNRALREVLHIGPDGASPVAPAAFDAPGGALATPSPAQLAGRPMLPQVRTATAEVPAGSVFEVFDCNGLCYLFPLHQLLGLPDVYLEAEWTPKPDYQTFGVLVTLTAADGAVLSEIYYPFNQKWHDAEQVRGTPPDLTVRFAGWTSDCEGTVEITNRGDRLVPWLHVSSPEIDPTGVTWSDNFLPLPPGATRRLAFTLRRPAPRPNEPGFSLEGLCPRIS